MPDDLWEATARANARALDSGALCPLETRRTVVEEGGVRYVVRVRSSLNRKARASGRGSASNGAPFLPYEDDLFVCDVSPTHVCLLNKFNVLARHLLIVTRAYEDQDEALRHEDLAAAARCLAAGDGLSFYNGGEVAGASQPHRHLQHVPFPLGVDGEAIPTGARVAAAARGTAPGRAPDLAFPHAVARVDGDAILADPDAAADALLATYRALLDAVGVLAAEAVPGTRPRPYNLLATRKWMLAVPRTREHFEGVSVNALGFAGSLSVADEDGLARVRAAGPSAVLRHVTAREAS